MTFAYKYVIIKYQKNKGDENKMTKRFLNGKIIEIYEKAEEYHIYTIDPQTQDVLQLLTIPKAILKRGAQK